MKKKIYIPVLLGLIALAVIIIFCVTRNDHEAAKPEIILSYAENQQSNYPTTQGGNYFAQLVNERTNGRIKIIVFDSGKLGTESDVLIQMKYGGIDMSRVSLSQLCAYAPEMNVLQMPYLYKDSDHMWRVLDGEIGERFINNISCTDYVGLSWYDAGARSFYTKTPVYNLDDLKGLVIRVQDSDLMIDAITALGAKAVTYDYAAVYSAIQTGSVDGAENNWPSYESMQHYTVAPYIIEDEHTRVPEMQIISAHTWNKLSDADKTIILDCARESALYERKIWKEREMEAKNSVIESGATVITISNAQKLRFRYAMSDVYEKYCKDQMDIIEEIIKLEQ